MIFPAGLLPFMKNSESSFSSCRDSCQEGGGLAWQSGAGPFPHIVWFSLVSICFLHERLQPTASSTAKALSITFGISWFNSSFAFFSYGTLNSFGSWRLVIFFGNHKHSQEDQGKLWRFHKWASLGRLNRLRLKKVLKVKDGGSDWWIMNVWRRGKTSDGIMKEDIFSSLKVLEKELFLPRYRYSLKKKNLWNQEQRMNE